MSVQADVDRGDVPIDPVQEEGSKRESRNAWGSRRQVKRRKPAGCLAPARSPTSPVASGPRPQSAVGDVGQEEGRGTRLLRSGGAAIESRGILRELRTEQKGPQLTSPTPGKKRLAAPSTGSPGGRVITSPALLPSAAGLLRGPTSQDPATASSRRVPSRGPLGEGGTWRRELAGLLLVRRKPKGAGLVLGYGHEAGLDALGRK